MHASQHILIVDGDAGSASALAREIGRLGFAAMRATTAAEAMSLALFRSREIDLLVIETDLPDADGRELVCRLRRRGVVLPIIVVSAAGAEDDVVWGLDAGADDYLVHPLRPREFAARIRALLRTAAAREETDVQIGRVTFRPSSRTIFNPALPRPVRLTEKEAALLHRLCRAEGRPVSRQTLLREVWGYSPAVSSHTVETHVYRLRRKIDPGKEAPDLLLNEDGGYRLCLAPLLGSDSRAASGERPAAMAMAAV